MPAGAAGQRETVQELSTLSWLSMDDFKGTHRSYLQEIAGSVPPAWASLFQTLTCDLQDLHTAKTIQVYMCQSLLYWARRMVVSSCQIYKRGWGNTYSLSYRTEVFIPRYTPTTIVLVNKHSNLVLFCVPELLLLISLHNIHDYISMNTNPISCHACTFT